MVKKLTILISSNRLFSRFFAFFEFFQGWRVVFTGTYQRSLDDKGRFLLPKRMRSEIGENPSLYLTRGTERCLELHTHESLNQLALRASQSASGSQNVKSFSRLFYANAASCDIDGQGRIRIPLPLGTHATLSNEIVIVGVGFNWEVWNPTLWNSYLATHEDEFDQISQNTFDQIGGAISVPPHTLASPASSAGENPDKVSNPR